MSVEVKPPSYFIPRLKALRKRNMFAKNWRLRLERKTNRHPDSDGYAWGWYEVFPFQQTVGYWGRNRDDLKNCDIKRWNEMADTLENTP